MEHTAAKGTSRTSGRYAAANASYLRQSPEKTCRYTLRKLSSSQRSIDPPSTCGESPSDAEPGGRRRIRSAYAGVSFGLKCRIPSLSDCQRLFRKVRTFVSDGDCLASTCGRDQ